jgi:hypothetical protein
MEVIRTEPSLLKFFFLLYKTSCLTMVVIRTEPFPFSEESLSLSFFVPFRFSTRSGLPSSRCPSYKLIFFFMILR